MKLKISIGLNIVLAFYIIFLLIFKNFHLDVFSIFLVISPFLNLYFLYFIYKNNFQSLIRIKKKFFILYIFILFFFLLFLIYNIFLNFSELSYNKIPFLIFLIINYLLWIHIFSKYIKDYLKTDVFKKKLKTFLKIIKWLFYLLIIGIFILLISVYISSLGKYTEEDFNIPKDAFKTKFADKDANSTENGFKEFVELTEKLNKKMKKFKYLDVKSRCIFGTNVTNFNCAKSKESELEKLRDEFIINSLQKKYGITEEKEKRKLKSKLERIKRFKSFYHIESIDKEIDNLNEKLNKLKPNDIEFYKVFNYLDNKKVYGDYKVFLERMGKIDENIKTMADVGKLIDKISNNVEIDKDIASNLNEELKKLYYNDITLADFIDYNKSYNLFEEEKEKIIKNKLKQFNIYTYIINKKFKEIEKADFIKPTIEYTGIYAPDKGQYGYGAGKFVMYSNLQSYFKISNYLIYKYFEEGKYKKGIDLLLKNQKFANFYLNKYDGDLIGTLAGLSINKINIEALEDISNNYNLDSGTKERIKQVLAEKLDNGLIKNALKNEHISNRSIFKYLWDDVLYDTIEITTNKEIGKKEKKLKLSIESFKTYLFYNPKETEILSDKFVYEYLENGKYPMDLYNKICVTDKKTGKVKKYNLSFNNLHNFIGRFLVCTSFPMYYDSQFQKEQKLRDLRKTILEKLN